jgi:hypothetical protein
MRAVAQLLGDGTLKASVDRVYRLSQIAVRALLCM